MGQLSGVGWLEPLHGVGHTYGEREVCSLHDGPCGAPAAVCACPVPVSRGCRPPPFLCLRDRCFSCKGNFRWCLLCLLGWLLLRVTWALVTRWDACVLCSCTALVTVAVLRSFCVMSWLKSTAECLISDSRDLDLSYPCTSIRGWHVIAGAQ